MFVDFRKVGISEQSEPIPQFDGFKKKASPNGLANEVEAEENQPFIVVGFYIKSRTIKLIPLIRIMKNNFLLFSTVTFSLIAIIIGCTKEEPGGGSFYVKISITPALQKGMNSQAGSNSFNYTLTNTGETKNWVGLSADSSTSFYSTMKKTYKKGDIATLEVGMYSLYDKQCRQVTVQGVLNDTTILQTYNLQMGNNATGFCADNVKNTMRFVIP